MTEQTAEAKFGRWTTPEIALSIEYRPELIGEIRTAGADVTGVLFGTHAEDSVRISAWRKASFSTKDPRELVRLLLAAKQDPSLEALQPVGWFLARKGGGISLSETDLEIFDEFFEDPWQVTLVLDGARAGFFAREPGGGLRSDRSYREFAIESSRPAAKPNYLRWLWALPTLLAIVLAGLLIRPEHPTPLNPGLSLRIQGDGQIFWNAASLPASSRAELDIQDGSQESHFKLTGAQLRAGKLMWQRHGADVQARMTVYAAHGATIREFARLTVSTVSVPAPAAAAADPHEEELKKLTEELHGERVQTEKLRNMVKILENRLGIEGERKP